ncbi:hypothetical protein ES703_73152 [subsurface metagenome]
MYDFEIETDGKTLKGIVEERDRAFKTYDRAIEEGDAAFLLDQESGDILYISMGNIKPEQEVTVCIRYVKQLSLVDGVVRLQIPTTVSPRYAPPDTDPLKVDRITPDYDLDVPYRLKLSVKLRSAFAADVNSPSHQIKGRREGEYMVVSLEDESTSLDRDFVLEITAANPDKPVCLWSTHENGDMACLFRFTPCFDELPGEEMQKSEIIFVLDCSGSMQGTSITEAKEALELSLRSLSEGELFNIVRFGTNYQVFRSQSMEYSSKSLKEALHYLQGIDADMGGTEIYRPLEYICSLPIREGYRRDVVLLTDGEVANPDEVIHLVGSSVEKIPSLRFFTFGIGYGASHHLVKGIARAGQGKCEMIMPGEKIQPKVLRQLSRMSQPSLTDVSLSFEAAEAETSKTLPSLFEGDSYSLLRKLNHVKAAAKVTFSGWYMGKHHRWDAELVDAGRDNTILTLWAQSKIERLKTVGVGGSNQRGRQQQRIKNEITQLGLRYNLLTDYTSFVAEEKRTDSEKQLEQPEYRRIPVMMTRDWHGIASRTRVMSLISARGPRIYSMGGPGLGESVQSGISKGMSFLKSSKSRIKRIIQQKELEQLFDFKMKPSSADTTEAEALWYLALLKTQQADGSFTGLKILSHHLGIPLKKLKNFSAEMDGISSKLQEKSLATWLAVSILSIDHEVSAVADRAIRKAKVWLSQHNVESPTVKGVPMEEALKERFGITLSPSR